MEKSKIAKIFCIHIAFVIAIALLLAICFNIEMIEPYYGGKFKTNPFLFFVFAVIFAPLSEEVVFRYQLVKTKHIYYFLAIGLFIGGTSKNGILALSFAIVTICSFIVYFFLKKEKLPIYIIIPYIILFTVFHITNYEVEELQKLTWYLIILQFFPQLLLGIILTVIRMKTRFLYAWVYHATYNFVFSLIAVIVYYLK